MTTTLLRQSVVVSSSDRFRAGISREPTWVPAARDRWFAAFRGSANFETTPHVRSRSRRAPVARQAAEGHPNRRYFDIWRRMLPQRGDSVVKVYEKLHNSIDPAVGIVAASKHPDTAQFVDFLLRGQWREILGESGYRVPVAKASPSRGSDHDASVDPLDCQWMRGSAYIARMMRGLRNFRDTRLVPDVAGSGRSGGKNVGRFKTRRRGLRFVGQETRPRAFLPQISNRGFADGKWKLRFIMAY